MRIVLTPAIAADHHSCMKSLFAVFLLAGGLALTSSCGPANAFCPNVAADAGGVCPIFGDDGMAPQMDTGTGNPCPSGQHLGDNPDGNISGGLVCVCLGTGAAPPCN
jgi:hypothetical protein